jgi:putative acetyltransferase
MVTIRLEQTEDIPAIRAVNLAAFAGPQEADLVDALRLNCDRLLSLVAVVEETVVGHILFSPVTITGEVQTHHGMGLAPMAVDPKFQHQEIGSQLIRRGLAILEGQRCPFIIVLGHADYYPRFGFERASFYNITSQWPDVPDEAFMLLLLDRSLVDQLAGVGHYRDEFNEAV